MNKIPCEYSKKALICFPPASPECRRGASGKRSGQGSVSWQKEINMLYCRRFIPPTVFLRKGFYDLAYCGADRCGGRHRADGDGFRRGRRFDAGAAAFVWCGHGVRLIDVHLYCADSFACVEIPPQNGLSVYRIADRRFFTVQRRDDQSDQVAGSAVDRSRLRRVSAGAFPLLSAQYRRS